MWNDISHSAVAQVPTYLLNVGTWPTHFPELEAELKKMRVNGKNSGNRALGKPQRIS